MTENHKLKITTNWRPVAGQPSPAWRRLAEKLLANRKKKPAGTHDASDGEMNNGNDANLSHL